MRSIPAGKRNWELQQLDLSGSGQIQRSMSDALATLGSHQTFGYSARRYPISGIDL